MTFSLSLAHTHVYAGCTGHLDNSLANRANTCLITLSDGNTVLGDLIEDSQKGWLLYMPNFATIRGHQVEAKTWRISIHKDGNIKILKKLND